MVSFRDPNARTRMGQISAHLRLGSAGDDRAQSNASESKPEVLLDRHSEIWTVTLNRPKSLNALNTNMVKLLKSYLKDAESSTRCRAVILQGEGRAFCAGGDVVTVTREASQGSANATDFFKEEYELDNFISKMRTPLIVMMDGVTMGGGVGLAVHAPFRVATNNTVLAMPETSIGLFPDVGASFFLSRLDNQLGTYLALTSERLMGSAVFQAGIASHFVPSARLSSLRGRLEELASSLDHDGINQIIEEHADDPEEIQGTAAIFDDNVAQAIDICFNQSTVEDIILSVKDRLSSSALRDWSTSTLEKLHSRSPTSLKVTLLELRHGRALNIDEAFQMEYGMAQQFCDVKQNPDFVSGVKHLLIDKKKDRAPWHPSTLEAVNVKKLEEVYFKLLPNRHDSSLPKLQLSDASQPFVQYPHRIYSLPTVDDVRQIVTGEHPSAGSFAMHDIDVVQTLKRDRKGKIGVENAAKRVIRRKCKSSVDGLLSWR